MVFQSYALCPHMTMHNMSVPLRMRRLSGWQRLPLIGHFLPGTKTVAAEIEKDVMRTATGALPAIIAFGIFSVVGHWNSLFWPLIAVRDQAFMPPPLGIMAFKNEEAGNDYGPLMAASTIVVAPLIIAFLSAQKWFVEGLTGGAVK